MIITAEERTVLQRELLKLSGKARKIVNKLLFEYDKQNYHENLSIEDLPGEIWKWVKNYENLYQVSNKARVKSFLKGKITILHQVLNNIGYLTVRLYKNGISKQFKIHRLVAEAFIPNPENKPEVDHIDGNKLNNRVENLRFVTSSENRQAAIKSGIIKTGSKHPNSKLTPDNVKYIRSNYKECDPEFGANALAIKFKVSIDTIYKVIKNAVYKDVD